MEETKQCILPIPKSLLDQIEQYQKWHKEKHGGRKITIPNIVIKMIVHGSEELSKEMV